MSLLRTFHTVRYLRPSQVVARACRPLLVPRALPRRDTRYRLVGRRPSPPAVRGAFGYDGKSFRFLNRSLAISGADRWQPAAASRLWLYNLHYGQYIWGVEASDAVALILDWIQENRTPHAVGWEPYPLSLRIREWLEWLLENRQLPGETQEEIGASVAQQAAVLSREVEHHLMGNHLLENAITLCWVGLSLEGPESDRWLRKGLRLLERELRAQVLEDGVHDERSPMYQALLTEALLRLAEIARASAHPAAARVASCAECGGRSMLGGLARFVHPDGEYALVNDAAFGIAPSWAELRQRFGTACDASSSDNGASGYLSWRSDGHYLLFDAGPLGPDHQPGHGHADALSLELSLHGRRVITDTGTYTYDVGPVRQADRSTAAHNTIEVDGQDQSELWAAFRCGRRIKAEAAARTTGTVGEAVLTGAYTGPRSVRHARRLAVSEHEIRLRDQVSVRGSHVARVRLHFAPGLDLAGSGGRWDVFEGRRRLAALQSPDLAWTRSPSPYHPEFGVEVERQSLTATVRFTDAFESSSTLHFL